jgi:hypothetical protein
MKEHPHLSKLVGLLLLLPALPSSAQQQGDADPAVWGPYAQWVGKTYVREQEDSEYGAYKIAYEWKEPGKILQETGYYKDGRVWFTQVVTPGKKPGELTADPKPGPKGTWRIVDPQTLASNTFFGYQTIRRATDAAGYEEQTLKGGAVENRRTYLDTASSQYQAHLDGQAAEQARKEAQAIAERRAAGVPEEAAVPVPAERVLAYQESVRGPSGTLQLTRGKAWEASVCYLAVYINDRLAARIDEGETATFKVPVGQLRVGVSADPGGRGTCRMGQSGQAVHVTPLARGEHLHVHIKFDGGVRFSEALLDPASP